MRQLKALWPLFLDYYDLLLAIAFVVIASYLGFRNKLQDDELTQAAIILLGVLGGVLLRERSERIDAVKSIDRAVESIATEKPWQLLDETLTWDMRSPESATCVSERDVRFLGPEVFTIHEYERGTSGSVTQRRAHGAARGDPPQELRILEPGIVGPEGRLYHVICLEGLWRRGDRMSLRYERQLGNAFLTDRENVSKEVQSETDRLVMRVAWPAAKPPTAVRLERPDGGSEPLKPKTRRGRATVQATVDNPRVGEVINIWWTW